MTTQDLIQAFVNGETRGDASGGRLSILGDRLFNYSTCLAQRIGDDFIVNVTKYSPSTSKHQNKLLRLIPTMHLITVQGLKLGANDLNFVAVHA